MQVDKQGKPDEKRVSVITEDRGDKSFFSRETVSKLICEWKCFLEIRVFSQFCPDMVRHSCFINQDDFHLKQVTVRKCSPIPPVTSQKICLLNLHYLHCSATLSLLK